MAISSVTYSTPPATSNPYSSPAPQPAKDSDQDSDNSSTNTSPTAPTPTVNSNGETIGQVLNVTA